MRRLPNPAQPSHLAALEFARLAEVPPDAVTLAAAIDQRCSDRRPYLPEPVPGAVLDALTAAADAEHASLTVADTVTARRELVVAMTTANAEQRDDPAYRTELATWAARGLGAVDGVPASSLRAPDPLARPLLARDFSPAGRGDLTTPPMDDGAVLAVLSTLGDDRRSWLVAGEALSAVLLTATATGLASCPLSQVAENDLARETVRTAVLGDSRQPQLLVRLGWPPNRTSPMPRSPRRPYSEVIAGTA
ncbi:MAG TPA: nitroreductase family protein [Pseudonocardiaceae bacterium]